MVTLAYITYALTTLLWVFLDRTIKLRKIVNLYLFFRVYLYISHIPLVILVPFRSLLSEIYFDYVILNNNNALEKYLVSNLIIAFMMILSTLIFKTALFRDVHHESNNLKGELYVIISILAIIIFLTTSGAISHYITTITDPIPFYLKRRHSLEGLSPLTYSVTIFFVNVLLPILLIYLVFRSKTKSFIALLLSPFTTLTLQKSAIFSVFFALLLKLAIRRTTLKMNLGKVIIGFFLISIFYYIAMAVSVDFVETKISDIVFAPFKIIMRVTFAHHISNLSFYSYQDMSGFMGVSSDRFLSSISGIKYEPNADLVFQVSEAVYGLAWSNNAGFVGSSFLMGGNSLIIVTLLIFKCVVFSLIISLKIIRSEMLNKLTLIYLIYLIPSFIGTNISTTLFFNKLSYISVIFVAFSLIVLLLRSVRYKASTRGKGVEK